MAALAFATTNTFVSCKDYDDDITDLRNEIDKLATADQLTAKVSEMQAAIAAAQSAAESKAAAAQSVADAAKAAAADAASAAKAAQDKADALEKNGATKAEVEAAQKAADAAKAAADKAQTDAAAAIAEVKAELQAAADAAAKAVQAAQAAADKAQADATSALSKIAELEEKGATKEEVAEAKADAAAAQATADKAVADAKAAQDKADAAKAAADAAQTTADTAVGSINAVIAGVNTELVNLKSLDAEIAGIKALLNLAGLEGVSIDLSDLSNRVNALDEKLKDIIGEYTTMVTDVDLYITDAYRYNNGLPNKNLMFVYVPQEKDTKFPANEGVADAQIEFSSENKNVTTTDSLVIRVSPTNAVLDPSNISLINSQGKELSEYVSVSDVKPYNKLIATRAAGSDNGLWVVTFKLKDGVDIEEFAKEVTVKSGNYDYSVKYAVAVKNTASADTRRVISAYDVDVTPQAYEAAYNNFIVQNNDGTWKNVYTLRNRYQYTDDKNFGVYSVETGQTKAGVAELAWKDEPQIAGSTGTVNAGISDQRYYLNLLDATVGQDININIAAYVGSDGQPVLYNPVGTTSGRGTSYSVKGFYVTLDKEFAIESNPSEWNAWDGYEYTNVGIPGDAKRPAHLFMGNEGSISINSEKANGDIIGFRVYVVNHDGTLVDPDGRAFYVQVGNAKETLKLTATDLEAKLDKHFDGSNYVSAGVAVNGDAFESLDNTYIDYGYVNENGQWVANQWLLTSNPTDNYGNNAIVPKYRYYDSNDNEYKGDVVFEFRNNKDEATVTKISDIAKVRVNILNPLAFEDGKTYTYKTTFRRNNGTQACDVEVSFKKTVPTTAPALKWASSDYDALTQVFANVDGGNGIYKIKYTTNEDDDMVIAPVEPQALKLMDMITDLKLGKVTSPLTYWYTVAFSGVDNKAVSTDYLLTVPANKIDNKEHAVTYTYDYGKIKLNRTPVEGKWLAENAVCPNAEADALSMVFASWIDSEKVEWFASYDDDDNLIAGGTPEILYRVGVDAAHPNVNTLDLANAIAWNTKLRNYNESGSAMFGESKENPVTFSSLVSKPSSLGARKYIEITKVEFSHPAYEVTYTVVGKTGSNDFTVTLTQKANSATSNPITSGTLTIKGKDCFGHEAKFELPVKIKQ